MPKTLAIIPARGGSKGLPGKNIRMLNGLPLIAWTINQAKASKLIDYIFVSTDSKEISSVAHDFGIEVPYLRPDFLSKDTSSSVDVVLNVLDYLSTKGLDFEYILLLEPTSPLRKINDLDNIIKLAYTNTLADGVISVGEVQLEHPSIVKKVNADGFIQSYIENKRTLFQRQQFDKSYFPYGVAYLIKSDVLLKTKSFYTDKIIPYYIERWQNYEIDDIYDFEIVKTILNLKLEENT